MADGGPVGVLVIHGMGMQIDESFATALTRGIHKELGRWGVPESEVPVEPVVWGDVLHGRQSDYLKRARATERLDWNWLREWVVQVVGDPAAYQRIEGAPASTYERVHQRIADAAGRLRSRVGAPDRPLVVLAHSLGAHVVSNFIWDLQRGNRTRPDDSFQAFDTLAGFVTFGCNLPLFALAHDPVIPIVFPAPALPAHLKDLARWWNFFDRDDVLGFPLRPVSVGYDLTVDEDVELPVGSVLTSWNPFSHGGYWRSREMARRIADLILDLRRTAG